MSHPKISLLLNQLRFSQRIILEQKKIFDCKLNQIRLYHQTEFFTDPYINSLNSHLIELQKEIKNNQLEIETYQKYFYDYNN